MVIIVQSMLLVLANIFSPYEPLPEIDFANGGYMVVDSGALAYSGKLETTAAYRRHRAVERNIGWYVRFDPVAYNCRIGVGHFNEHFIGRDLLFLRDVGGIERVFVADAQSYPDHIMQSMARRGLAGEVDCGLVYEKGILVYKESRH